MAEIQPPIGPQEECVACTLRDEHKVTHPAARVLFHQGVIEGANNRLMPTLEGPFLDGWIAGRIEMLLEGAFL